MEIQGVISDMDGVLYRGSELIPGADEFVHELLIRNIPFLFLTNNSGSTPAALKQRLSDMGIHGIEEKHFITAAMATAMFLKQQAPGARLYVIGGDGLHAELRQSGFDITEDSPDYVVVGKTRNFNFDMMKKASYFIHTGAKFLGTNPDLIDPVEGGYEPACGSILASIEIASSKKPYIIGKPNSLMMTLATKKMGVHPDDTLMIGDRMDTDIIGGLEAGMQTCLMLSGVTERSMLSDFPYKPDFIYENLADFNQKHFP